MKTAIIFGAGGTGRKVFSMIQDEYEVLCFIDNSVDKENTEVCGKRVYLPQMLPNLEYDVIFIGTLMGLAEVKNQLAEVGIGAHRIKDDYVVLSVKSRELFLTRFAELAYAETYSGQVAEAGVYRGEFAKTINRCFPDRTLYLFDTFAGFDASDIQAEPSESLVVAEYLSKTSVKQVLQKMPHPEKCVIKKGVFPSTAEGVEEEFCFVNLDMDLYQPILSGLQFFYPRMVCGGIILIHDYFSEAYPCVEMAVKAYKKQTGKTLCCTPIGDDISLAIVKTAD